MKAFLRSVVAGLLALVLTAAEAFAQERPAFSPEQLDQMLAPIALYPDPLLSQILMAATYPLEVVQAARWSRANPHLKGQDAVRAVEAMDWDPSVKSLVAFPQVLHRMDEQLDWTERLGEAFLAQETHVMNSIQGLRQKAEQAGTLRSNEQMRVTRQDDHILIEPAYPQVVYVPYYNPAVVYGSWWWPAYPPVYWGPPPGYYAWPAFSSGFFWGAGVAISRRIFFGHFDWRHRHVNVVNVVHQPSLHTVPISKPVKWQHDPVHRRNVPFRHTVWRQPAGQHPAMRGDERSRPAVPREPHNARPESRGTMPQTRLQSATPQTRPQSMAPQPRSERSAPQVGDRLPDRAARMESQRPQTRAPEQRPSIAQRTGPLPRPVAPPHVVRAEPRSTPPTANARVAPRHQPGPVPRTELSNAGRLGGMIPRAAAGAPMNVPHAIGNHASGGARAHGGGHSPAMSAGRGGGRS